MKKEDAKYILDFIEWIYENATIDHDDVESFGNQYMNSFNLIHEELANEGQPTGCNCNIQHVSNRFSPLKNDTSDANMICILTERYNEIAAFLNGC